MPLNHLQLQAKHVKVYDALQTLKEALIDIQQANAIALCAKQDPERVYKTYRDSLIQRFEYTFDTTWKYLRDYLEYEGKSPEIKTPKSIFRECLKAGILSDNETRMAIEMVDHRNLTTHVYDQELIDDIVSHLHDYMVLIDRMITKTDSKTITNKART